MGIFSKRSVRLVGPGLYQINFAEPVRDTIAYMVDQIDEVLDGDSPIVRRLFPTAYPHDPELDAGYQILARDELIDQRRLAIAEFRSTVDRTELSEEQLMSWMAVINDGRLVLGTILDLSEDDVRDIPEDHPHYGMFGLYDLLSYVLSEIVDGLSDGLPEL